MPRTERDGLSAGWPRPARAVACVALLVAAVWASSGCGEGEVTTLVLPVSPDNGPEFIVAQQAMLTVGCGIGGCHATTVGNFQVSENAATRQDEYLMAKGVIDQAAPGESALLRVALAGDPAAVGHPICFANTDGCAWGIITAWIADDDAALASSIAKTCTPTESACFAGGD